MLAAVCWSGAAAADRGLRCGQYLMRPGDTKVEVLAHCGEPLFREVVSGGRGAESPIVEQWYYTFGPQRFTRVLTFRGIELVTVDSGSHPR